MSDPLSISASLVGLVVPALHATRLLLRDIQKIIDAPDNLIALKDQLLLVDQGLGSLKAIRLEEWESLGETIVTQFNSAAEICTTACEALRADLQRWTKHSAETLSWRDRAKIGFWKQPEIEAMHGQLKSCQTSITLVVSTATLYSSIRQNRTTEGIQEAIAATQNKITVASRCTDLQRTDVEHRQADFDLTNDIHQARSLQVLDRLQEEQRAVDVTGTLLKELSCKVQELARSSAAKTTITFGNHNTGIQVGMSNGTINFSR